MTNEYNFKVGDRAYINNNGICTIVGIDDKKWFPVEIERADGSRSRFGRDSLEDVKTAFLTRLGALLKEFDARIYDHDDYRLYIDLVIHGDMSERIVYSDTEGEIDADNIMDFDKE